MQTAIYTLERDDLSIISDRIPAFVKDRTGAPGYFTIGASGGIVGDDRLIGVCQFYIGSFPNGACFGRLDYIYVAEDARLNGIGRKLINRMDTILRNSGISTGLLRFPKKGGKLPGFTIKRDEAEAFFEKCGFFPASDEEAVFFSDIKTLSKNLSAEEKEYVSELSGLSDEEFSSLLSDIGKEKPLPMDLSKNMDDYDLNMSFSYREKDRGGVILISRYGYSMAEVSLLRAFGKNEKEGLSDLALKALIECRERMDDDFLIVMSESALSDGKSLKGLFPGIKRIELSKYIRFTTG